MAARGSSAWRLDAWGSGCKPDLVAMPIYAGGPKFQANLLARDPFILLGAAFLRHRYIIHTAGCYNCRRITGGTSLSSHSWGTSVDVNEATNPYRRDKLVTDMTSPMIEDVYEIRTADGVQVFRWGGDWDGRPDVPNSNYDAMHFEIIATPDELAAGFVHEAPATVAPLHFPVIRRGARGPLVVNLQNMLKLERTTGNGRFGPRTETAVKIYQRSHGLVADGIVGAATWTALITHQPAITAGGIPPQKKAA